MFKKADFNLNIKKDRVRGSHYPMPKKQKQADFDNSLDSVPDDESEYAREVYKS